MGKGAKSSQLCHVAPLGERAAGYALVTLLVPAGPAEGPMCVDTAVPGPTGSAKPLRVWIFAAELVWQKEKKKKDVGMYV